VRLEQQEETRNVRPDQVVRVRSGLRDGRFTAIEMTLRSNAGAGPASPDDLRGPGEALGLYRCPNVGYEARAAATNLPPSGPLPVAAGSFAMESHVDEVAAALGEDPLELRRRNVVVEGDVPAFGVMGSCRLDEAIAKGAKAIGWGRKRKRGRANGRRRGLGMALSVRGSGPMGTAGAALRMNEDGSFQLALGHAVRGGGAETAAAQIVAETLQVDLGRIVVVTGETDMAPPGRGIPGFAATAGVAQAAARRVLEQLLETAARALGAESAGLVVEDGRVRRADGRAAAFTELAAHAAGTIEASASQPPEPRLGACAAVFAAVEVDEETGRVRVADLVEAVDCGLAVNPAAVAGRIEGDAVGALAHALHPVVSHDGEGRPAGRALRDAGRLTALETPSIEVALVGAPDPAAPLGVKSLGHVGSNAVAAAVANAVADALGARVRELPLSPERVLAAMERREPPGGERG
jgi:CO/xanthine dehydrogenase Mo-binding subunit